MRRVVGKTTVDLSASDLAQLRLQHKGLLLDLGCGDGKHVVSVARARPELLVVGLDANPDAMRRTAARAASAPRRGGVPNALFVWAPVEALPAELTDVSELRCLMPWGSLLRALARPDVDVLRSLAAACAPGAPFLVTLNLHAWRPRVPEVGDTPEPAPNNVGSGIAAAFAAAGWQLEHAYRPDQAELRALGTSWTKRLGSSREELDVLALRGVVRPPAP